MAECVFCEVLETQPAVPKVARPESWCGQYGSQISQVLRPSRNASARSNQEVRKAQPSSSPYAAVHPPRSNPPRRSSSGPPGPWYTPSTLSIIDAVSFMVIAPSHRGRRWLDDRPNGGSSATASIAPPTVLRPPPTLIANGDTDRMVPSVLSEDM